MDSSLEVRVDSYRNWTLTAGNLVGLAGMALALTLVAVGEVSWHWLLPWPLLHLFNAVMVSAGLHRYFSHGSFKTSPFWHRFIALYSVTLQYGSPYAWAVAHTTHHVHSDTDRDPHFVGLSYLLTKRYIPVPMVQTRLRRISGDPVLDFVHRHWLSLWAIWAGLLLALSPTVFLYLYLLPMGSAHLAGAVHQVVSHRGGAPRTLPWLELVCPTGGEWLHGTHHDHPRRTSFRTRWWHIDPGAAFVRLIQTKGPG